MKRGASNSQLVGNRMVLTGAVMYLLEWVAIIWSGIFGVSSTAVVGASEADILSSYRGHEKVVAVMAGWFSVVLLGRILLIVGLKASLAAAGRPHALMDFAVGAMVVSVTLEIATYGLAAAAAQLGAAHRVGMLAVEWAAGMMNFMIFGGVGVSLLCAALVMRWSGLFPAALTTLGIVGGAALTLSAVLVEPAFPTASNILGLAVFLLWIWMLWAGVLLWRRAPKGTEVPVSQAGALR
jgi:hypothetical protein